jgi:hypothetical protein
MAESLVERIIQVQLGPQARQGLRIGSLANHCLHRISRGDVEQQKRHQQDTEQGGSQQQQTLKEKPAH